VRQRAISARKEAAVEWIVTAGNGAIETIQRPVPPRTAISTSLNDDDLLRGVILEDVTLFCGGIRRAACGALARRVG